MRASAFLRCRAVGGLLSALCVLVSARGSPVGQPLVIGEPPDDATDIDAILDAREMVRRLQHSVFNLHVEMEGVQGVASSGTGFLVRPHALAITNFHVIRGGARATAHFVGIDEDLPVELWSVDPGIDLALVRVDLSSLPFGQPIQPLALADAIPDPAEEVWAIGFPRGLGATVTRGVVNGIRRFDQLPEALKGVLDYDSDSIWIQTDCTINSGNSGGPLVDLRGRVVGITTWTWPAAENAFFALSGQHVRRFLESIPSEPVTFVEAAKQYGGIHARFGGFPQLVIPRDGTARDLTRRLQAFRRAVVCPTCDAVGKVRNRVRVGEQRKGGYRVPIYENRVETCPRCKGERLSPNVRRIQDLAKAVVGSVAGLSEADAGENDAREVGRQILAATLATNPARLAFSVNDIATRSASIANFEKGEPVVLVGKLVADARVGESDGRIRLVQLSGTNQRFVIGDARIANAAEGEQVFAGGLFAGFIHDAEGEVQPVLQGGFIVGPRSIR